MPACLQDAFTDCVIAPGKGQVDAAVFNVSGRSAVVCIGVNRWQGVCA